MSLKYVKRLELCLPIVKTSEVLAVGATVVAIVTTKVQLPWETLPPSCLGELCPNRKLTMNFP